MIRDALHTQVGIKPFDPKQWGISETRFKLLLENAAPYKQLAVYKKYRLVDLEGWKFHKNKVIDDWFCFHVKSKAICKDGTINIRGLRPGFYFVEVNAIAQRKEAVPDETKEDGEIPIAYTTEMYYYDPLNN